MIGRMNTSIHVSLAQMYHKIENLYAISLVYVCFAGEWKN
ncbi:hypothetical protein B4064_1472 [Caldibacillus thermoamylovorans]|uniref:Uncharacterized protein n=1 Tax=Caldibacillus thermoamylovorans TaxID=35841 RepID=A0A0D0FWD3_9BACI|nr:hypothetical protein B4065_2555 [Caldibacillus thermoamylovorans]KIO68180.1 hypothetical protein B4166_2211 [Caldibacillus thermoamylovorans]KIO68971.1 hypothetical protein B4064_1472 [Caldibacillus thermoamylovorans]KIO72140.1 hypothetical protein B4167_3115 [Caldibacillus thermoamylovorans]